MYEKKLIIYIAGYGRSGSTVLDLALGAVCDDVLSLGEVATLPLRMYKPRLGCSCGVNYPECKVWGSVEGFIGQKSVRGILGSPGSYEGVLAWLLLTSSRKFGRVWAQIIDIRERAGGKKTRAIIDSSKTTYAYAKRPLLLASSSYFEVFVVHLQRPLNEVLASRAKGTNAELSGRLIKPSMKEKMFGGLWRIRTIIGWMLANRLACFIKKNKKICGFIDVQFSEVKNNAEQCAIRVLNEINRQCAYNFEARPTIDGFVKPVHIVEGNRLTSQKKVKIRNT